ncbi:DUF2076 domain-containing protein [Microvirga guangxiensis]|uniref:DUF2076 domain-containing protein n=1 Tax=Microvirga guangxiensis TaxID=549386 RepID=A0A1G5KUF1_9HYPH|nr:DUF2076 domain-containing protein [Microvirga guangxiensis]SCZ04245.1 hypothetical protein SAMN02927923_03603 [Microvirga guangxiensis]
MNDQEREVIADIFRRLEQVANQPRDPEAERFIAEKLRQQPYAPYAMAQTVFVQEQALARLQQENDQLRAELDHASRQPQQSGGFLSSIFGGGARPPEPAYNTPPARRASPWGAPQGTPQQSYGVPPRAQAGPWGGGMMQPRGGFLQSALSTAAGVAGGMMIANALSHAFSGNDNPTDAAASSLADLGNDQGGNTDLAGITDSLYGNHDQSGDDFSDFGGDAGDDGDWA